MWHPALPYWEFIVRGVAVYLLLLVLSNAVQNSMNGGISVVKRDPAAAAPDSTPPRS